MVNDNHLLKIDIDILLNALNSDRKIAASFVELSKDELLFLTKLCLEHPKYQPESILADNLSALIEIMQTKNFLSPLFANDVLFSVLISRLGNDQTKKILQKDYLEYLEMRVASKIDIEPDQIDDLINNDGEKFDMGKFLLYQKLKTIDKHTFNKYAPLYDLNYLRTNIQKYEKQTEEIQILRNDNKRLNLQISDQKQDFKELEKTNKKLIEQNKKLQDNLNNKSSSSEQMLLKKLHDLELENSQMEEQIGILKENIRSLNQTLDKSYKSKPMLLELQTLQLQVASTLVEIQNLKDENQEFQRLSRIYLAENERYNNQNKRLRDYLLTAILGFVLMIIVNAVILYIPQLIEQLGDLLHWLIGILSGG